MTRSLLNIFAALAFHFLVPFGSATEPMVLKLWPAEPPGPAPKVTGLEEDTSKAGEKLVAERPVIRLGNVSTPQMHVFLPPPEKANGAAVIVCPGGGFSILAWDLEGTEVAEWLNAQGITAVVLKYRVPTRDHGTPGKWLGPVMDAQRALSLTRSRAAEWRLDPARIGVMGFSAGGEAAAHTALKNGARAYEKIDATDDVSCAANFALLIYPGGLADDQTGELKPEVVVTKDAPPMFFAHAGDDRVSSLNSAALYTALKNSGVPAELHIFANGGHGYGLRATSEPVTQWPQLATAWLTKLAPKKETLASAEVPTIHRDLEYARVGKQALKLDLYLPAGAAKPFPLIVWVHGGAWRVGTKAEMPLASLMEQGFAVASVDYRLSTEAPFPAQAHDIKAALRFLAARWPEYHYDPTRIAIAGASAGGHLAALVGVTNGNRELEGEVGEHLRRTGKVRAIVSFFGASNLQTILAQSTPHGLSVRVPALQLLLGGQPDEKVELARLASPVAHVDAGDPPLFLLHGDADPQMPPEQSRELRAAYEKEGCTVRFEIVEGGKHGGPEFYEPARLQRVADFLRGALK